MRFWDTVMAAATAPGGAGSFYLDFTPGTLPAAVTLTRASSGTYFDASGVMQTASSNVARFDHNPATLAALGLMVEPAATNLALRSEDFSDAAWTKAAATITANDRAAPDGATTADRVTAAAGTNTFNMYGSNTTIAAGSATFSFYAAYGNAQWLWVRLDRPDTVWVAFDLLNGVVGNKLDAGAVVSSYTITSIGGGLYRCVATWTSTGGAGSNMCWNAGSGSTPTGAGVVQAGTEYYYLWGADIEAGAPTSYIATAGASATRALDEITVTVPAGYSSLLVTFDDDSTQVVACAAGANVYDASDFDRNWLKSMEGQA